jgi:hypothetical protein
MKEPEVKKLYIYILKYLTASISNYISTLISPKRQKLTGLETDIACLKTNLSLKILFKNI